MFEKKKIRWKKSFHMFTFLIILLSYRRTKVYFINGYNYDREKKSSVFVFFFSVKVE